VGVFSTALRARPTQSLTTVAALAGNVKATPAVRNPTETSEGKNLTFTPFIKIPISFVNLNLFRGSPLTKTLLTNS
jgi:hypothetical protein